jgi:hypothetical protein
MNKCVEANLNEGGMKAERQKLQALRLATAHSFPTADIDEMLAQIEDGYSKESS